VKGIVEAKKFTFSFPVASVTDLKSVQDVLGYKCLIEHECLALDVYLIVVCNHSLFGTVTKEWLREQKNRTLHIPSGHTKIWPKTNENC
jgi:hypothetical protein